MKASSQLVPHLAKQEGARRHSPSGSPGHGLVLLAEKEPVHTPRDLAWGPRTKELPGHSPSDEHNLFENKPLCFPRLKAIPLPRLPVIVEGRGLFSHLFKAPEPSMSQAMCRDTLLIFS